MLQSFSFKELSLRTIYAQTPLAKKKKKKTVQECHLLFSLSDITYTRRCLFDINACSTAVTRVPQDIKPTFCPPPRSFQQRNPDPADRVLFFCFSLYFMYGVEWDWARFKSAGRGVSINIEPKPLAHKEWTCLFNRCMALKDWIRLFFMCSFFLPSAFFSCYYYYFSSQE